MWGTIIISVALATALFFAVRSIVKNRSHGCSCCNGDCKNCRKRG